MGDGIRAYRVLVGKHEGRMFRLNQVQKNWGNETEFKQKTQILELDCRRFAYPPASEPTPI